VAIAKTAQIANPNFQLEHSTSDLPIIFENSSDCSLFKISNDNENANQTSIEYSDLRSRVAKLDFDGSPSG
jgi:hypothetical protein